MNNETRPMHKCLESLTFQNPIIILHRIKIQISFYRIKSNPGTGTKYTSLGLQIRFLLLYQKENLTSVCKRDLSSTRSISLRFGQKPNPRRITVTAKYDKSSGCASVPFIVSVTIFCATHSSTLPSLSLKPARPLLFCVCERKKG
ncbi:hypothetical protein CEXT_146921 [Caerostris extrusa]|uniref:Uncharacterized protein n=1 Tax=Caerostris extrusa TaxID=172846 RepID=A0AAV4XXB0_CAEEX|nr:hypothetical protein CEXT_146921 [Caerostris extrusa]